MLREGDEGGGGEGDGLDDLREEAAEVLAAFVRGRGDRGSTQEEREKILVEHLAAHMGAVMMAAVADGRRTIDVTADGRVVYGTADDPLMYA